MQRGSYQRVRLGSTSLVTMTRWRTMASRGAPGVGRPPRRRIASCCAPGSGRSPVSYGHAEAPVQMKKLQQA